MFVSHIIHRAIILLNSNTHPMLLKFPVLADSTTISFLFEDSNEHVTILTVENYPTSFYSKDDVESVFSWGTVWLIREPTCTYSLSGQMVIKVDSPSDILPVAHSVAALHACYLDVPNRFTSLEECRLKGREEFNAGRFLSASTCYNEGL